MEKEMHILRHATVVMGRPLSGMWAYDLLSVVDFLAQQKVFDTILVAGRGREMGLACLMASVLDNRIDATAIEGMFSSFVQLVGYENVAPQIHGILHVADVEHLVRAAGIDRVSLNNVDESEWGTRIASSAKPTVDFFKEWLIAASK
jgi:hypothetical protein